MEKYISYKKRIIFFLIFHGWLPWKADTGCATVGSADKQSFLPVKLITSILGVETNWKKKKKRAPGTERPWISLLGEVNEDPGLHHQNNHRSCHYMEANIFLFFFFFYSWMYPNSSFHGSHMSGITNAVEYFVFHIDAEVGRHWGQSSLLQVLSLSKTNITLILHPSGTSHHNRQHSYIIYSAQKVPGSKHSNGGNYGNCCETNHVDKNLEFLTVIIQAVRPRLQSWHHGLWPFFTCSSSIVVLMHLKIKIKPGLHKRAQIKTRM